jgi:hypothetical protein
VVVSGLSPVSDIDDSTLFSNFSADHLSINVCRLSPSQACWEKFTAKTFSPTAEQAAAELIFFKKHGNCASPMIPMLQIRCISTVT